MKIEKNIPLPITNNEIASKMEVGDSVLCETKEKAEALRYAINKIGYARVNTSKDGSRVWRLK